MKPGKAFEIFVKRLLMCVGFSEVMSDGLYIYDAAPGQMIQGLGEAHNADVLLEPPVQTPFCASSSFCFCSLPSFIGSTLRSDSR